jgi:phage repressor protein C with HTH and peptisase S24 domain/predicted transcriptional regulator
MTKKRILPPDRIAECLAAHELFLSKKNALGLSQKKIADEAGMTPAAVNLYFKGINPLNVQFAGVLSRMLGEPVEKFSPRLADEIKALTTGTAAGKVPALSGSSSGSAGDSGAARKVLEMIQKHAGKGLDRETQERIATAALTVAAETKGKVIEVDFSGLKARPEEILIPQYDVRASLGDGQVPPDYNEAIRNLVVREDLLREKGVSYTSSTALAMVTGWGQSMEGTIEDKDPVIVDRGVKDYQGEGVYLLTWHGDLFIKRLQRMDEDHVWLISDNPKVKDQNARFDDVTIHAKVLMVWNAKKL